MEIDSPGTRSSDPPSDRSLLWGVRAGDDEAATQLYRRYAGRLRALIQANCSSRLARSLDTEDLLQSVFRKFFQGIRESDYDVPRGQDLWGLFLVIALNRIRNAEKYHRAGKRDVRMTTTDDGSFLQYHPSGEKAAHAVFRLTLQEALESLPPQHRQMVELRLAGHEVGEIASRTGRSRRTVERNLQEVRKRLGKFLQPGK